MPDNPTTPEQDRLEERFKPQTRPDGSTIQLVSMRPWWGPKAANMTAEERAKVLNDVMDQAGLGQTVFPDIGPKRQKIIRTRLEDRSNER